MMKSRNTVCPGSFSAAPAATSAKDKRSGKGGNGRVGE
jgi:hypothetical protein